MTASQLLEFINILKLPDFIQTPNCHCFSKLEALGLMMSHFWTGSDEMNLSTVYCQSQSAISEIINWVTIFLDDKWKHLLDWDHKYLLSHEKLQIYATAIHEKGAPIDTVFSWPDCTKHAICHPSRFQQMAYKRHDRIHCLKFQALVIPNGMFAHLYGPVEGRKHDMLLWNESGIADKLAAHAVIPDLDNPEITCPYQVYGDAAYQLSPHVLSPFSGPGVHTQDEQRWNGVMRRDQVSIENAFAILGNLWPFLHSTYKLWVYSSPVGHYYCVVALLTNAVNCCNPNQIAQHFDCQLPTLTEYFHH